MGGPGGAIRLNELDVARALRSDQQFGRCAFAEFGGRVQDVLGPAQSGHRRGAGKNGVTAQQGAALRTADANGGKPTAVEIEDGSSTVDIWFSPNTPSSRGKNKTGEACPPDLAEIFSIVRAAQQAVLFLAFQPGAPSIIDIVAEVQKTKPSLFIRGAVTDAGAANRFYVGIKGEPPPKSQKRPKGSPPLPQDYRVISARGVTDNVGVWEDELNSAGHAVIHDKILVVDPFTDNCVVVTGSHNLGYAASYNNDENMAVIRGHRALAEAYAAHVLDIYDHYAWRYWLEQKKYDAAWTFLTPSDAWQDSYFDASNAVKSAELNFWLSASPSTEALPTLVDPAVSIRARRPYRNWWAAFPRRSERVPDARRRGRARPARPSAGPREPRLRPSEMPRRVTESLRSGSGPNARGGGREGGGGGGGGK